MRSKYEVKAQKELEMDGYLVDNKSGMGRWAKNRDFFNLFDLVAVKRGTPVRWISIKGKQGVPPAHKKEIKEFWLPDNNIKEIWKHSESKNKYWYKQIV